MAEIAFRVGPTVKWISGINEQTTCKVGSSFFSLHGRSSPSCLNPAKVNFGALATTGATRKKSCGWEKIPEFLKLEIEPF